MINRRLEYGSFTRLNEIKYGLSMKGIYEDDWE